MCQQLENQCSRRVDQRGTLRFHTQANYVHLCWKATALARRPSDSIKFLLIFFLNSQFSLHPFPGSVQIPLCVYTAAAQYGPFLICSIKHIVYKRVCLLGFFRGSNYQVKYHRKKWLLLSTVASKCTNGKNFWTELPASESQTEFHLSRLSWPDYGC